MERDFLSQLEAAAPAMSKRQRQLAEYIFANSSASHMTAIALAEAVGISESTVVRFAMAMGYEGYPEMQRAFRESLRVRMTTVERIEDANDRLRDSDIADAVLRADSEKILSTLRDLDRDAFERAVTMLLGARRIYYCRNAIFGHACAVYELLSQTAF